MINRNPQLSAIALLVHKFGEKIAGGGFEVRITAAEMKAMSPHGTFQEVPDFDGRGVRWQYFPNVTIDAEGHVVPDSVTPEGVTAIEKADERTDGNVRDGG